MRYPFLILLFLWSGHVSIAQWKEEIYVDGGRNNVSAGIFCRVGSLTSFEYKNYKAQTGLLANFSHAYSNKFGGWFLEASRKFQIKKIPFGVNAFFRINPSAKMLNEMNWGILIKWKSKHLDITLGDNLRIFEMKKKAVKESGISKGPDTRIIERRNLMYNFSLFLKPTDNRWNTGITITNFDNFYIEEETNPILMGQFLYRINTHIQLKAQAWYTRAGMFNLRVNTFGMYFRTALEWKF